MMMPRRTRQAVDRMAPAVRHALWLVVMAASFTTPVAVAAPSAPAAQMIVVAIVDKPDPVAGAGSIPRGYGGLPNYAGSERAHATAAQVAADYGLHEVSAWTIDPLRLRCILYELPAAAMREETLARLRADRRVQLAQPLQEFSTLTAPGTSARPVQGAHDATSFNDPYVGLQSGFTAIGAGAAQRYANGEGVRIAVIDTGIDASHPDLAGRITEQRDFVARTAPSDGGEQHGTEVAGVIAAVANNHVGIVGVAPDAQVLSYRACWTQAPGGGSARCDTYTLALALGAAISSGAHIINLSLGGPSDPLLGQLAGYAIEHGVIVVGAVPPDGRMGGFPVGVPGVIAVRGSDDAMSERPALVAPGRDILTLEPGGHYDYASGSSLAAAHVSGALALLLQLDPRLDAPQLFALLKRTGAAAQAPIDACGATRSLSGNPGACGPVTARPPSPDD